MLITILIERERDICIYMYIVYVFTVTLAAQTTDCTFSLLFVVTKFSQADLSCYLQECTHQTCRLITRLNTTMAVFRCEILLHNIYTQMCVCLSHILRRWLETLKPKNDLYIAHTNTLLHMHTCIHIHRIK